MRSMERRIFNDPFLLADRIQSEGDAITASLLGALQRNLTYAEGVSEARRNEFRKRWVALLREEASCYSDSAVSDVQHCASLRRISDNLSLEFGSYLVGRRFRLGTAQKSFNLYLKYIWRMGRTQIPPPHCPIDSIVLQAAGIDGNWTKCDSEHQYMDWVGLIRNKAHPLHIADWEYDIWLREALKRRSTSSSWST